jgi:hypothetical protein
VAKTPSAARETPNVSPTAAEAGPQADLSSEVIMKEAQHINSTHQRYGEGEAPGGMAEGIPGAVAGIPGGAPVGPAPPTPLSRLSVPDRGPEGRPWPLPGVAGHLE